MYLKEEEAIKGKKKKGKEGHVSVAFLTQNTGLNFSVKQKADRRGIK